MLPVEPVKHPVSIRFSLLQRRIQPCQRNYRSHLLTTRKPARESGSLSATASRSILTKSAKCCQPAAAVPSTGPSMQLQHVAMAGSLATVVHHLQLHTSRTGW
jgi:hypothetical protein